MKSRLDRILLAFGLLMCFAAAAGFIYGRLATFHGQVTVAVGGHEDVVVSPAENVLRYVAPGVVQGIPGRVVPFTDPQTGRGVFGVHGTYHVTRLPFLLSCNKIDVLSASEAHNVLNITSPEGKTSEEVQAGAQYDICGSSYSVRTVDKWSGLVRDSNGIAMAELSVRQGPQDWSTVMLTSGEWRVGAGIATFFAWHASEQEASDAAAKGLAGVASARWGVVDRGAVNWFASFAPGTGATLSNGDSVTLLRLDPEHPGASGARAAIEVELEQKGVKSNFWVEANTKSGAAPVRFDDPAGFDQVFLVHAWEEDKALVSAFEKGNAVAQRLLGSTETLGVDEGELRLDQVLEQALPLSEQDSTIFAATLAAADGRPVRLRQGESVRVGDCLVEFMREERPPLLRSYLVVNGKSVALDTDESVRAGDWCFRLLSNPKAPYKVVLLEAELTPLKNTTRALFAFAVAVFIWLAVKSGPLFPASHLV